VATKRKPAPPATQTASIASGHAWAEEQAANPSVPDAWRATWQEAVRTGRAPDDMRHESAGHCAAAANSRWRELRPHAPPAAPPRKSKSGTSRSWAELRAQGKRRIEILATGEDLALLDALCRETGHTRAEHVIACIRLDAADFELRTERPLIPGVHLVPNKSTD
jgi:hypothetical protein